MFTHYQNTVFYINIHNFVKYKKLLKTKLRVSNHKPNRQNSGLLLKSCVGIHYLFFGYDSGLLIPLPFPVSITWLIFDLLIYFPGIFQPYISPESSSSTGDDRPWLPQLNFSHFLEAQQSHVTSAASARSLSLLFVSGCDDFFLFVHVQIYHPEGLGPFIGNNFFPAQFPSILILCGNFYSVISKRTCIFPSRFWDVG